MKIRKIHLSKSALVMIVFLSILIISAKPSFSDWEDVVDEFVPIVNISPQTNNASFSGAASESIRIAVPPGRKGIEPNLSLTYNSYAKNGWVGVGWNLELGAIRRSTKNGLSYSSDEYVVTFNGSTSELVSIDSYGNYRAKIESAFTEYKLDSGSDEWVATTRDGTKYYYGREEGDYGSRQDNPSDSSQIFAWYLDGVEDTNGNYMEISYVECDENDIYPYEIEYTGNGSVLPTYSVRFYLEDRNDLTPSYITKYKVINTKRLKTIEVLYGDTSVRAYSFEYKEGDSADSKRSLLEKIWQYGSDVDVSNEGDINSGTSLPVTTLTYTQYETGDFNFVEEDLDPHEDLLQIKPADFNGDGKTDYLENEFVNGYPNNYYIHFSNGNGTFDTELIDILPNGYDSVWFAIPGDFNGDGMADLIVGYTGLHPFRLYESNGDGTFTDKGDVYDRSEEGGGRCLTPVDFNGDGKTDFLINKTTPVEGGASWYAYLSDGNGTFTDKGEVVSNAEWENYIVPGDFNGDGKTDFMVNTNDLTDAWWIYLAVGDNGDFTCEGAISTSESDWMAPTMGDFNGDGLSDFMIDNNESNREWLIYLSKGNGTFEHMDSLSDDYYLGSQGVGDFNGDGFTDIIMHSSTAGVWYVYLSDGDGNFRRSSTLSSITSYSFSPQAGDFDADGKSDILLIKKWAGAGTTAELYVCFSDTEEEISPDLIKSVSNGSGGVKTYGYTLSSEYENDLMPFVLQTLSSINIEDDFGGSYTTNYTYSGGLFSHDTREFRGFQISEKENPDNTSIKTTYHQGEYLKGRSQQEDFYDENSSNFGYTQYTWDDSEEVAPGSYFVQLTEKTTTYPNDGADGVEIKEEYDYSSTHGGIESKKVSGNDEGQDPVITETDWEDYGDWIWRVSEERIMDEENPTDWLRRTEYEYDNINGNLLEKYYYLSDTETLLETFTYDDYGNPTGGTLPRTTDEYPSGIPKPTVVYEDDTHTYPATITNVLGHTVEMTYNYKFGKVSGQKDPNGHWTYYDYDEFGDVEREYTMDSVVIVADKNTVHHRNTSPRYVVNEISESEDSTIDSYTYVDGLGRTLLTATRGAKEEGEEDKAVVTYKYYDNMNRNYRTDGPYFVEGVGFPLEADDYYDLLPPSGTYSHPWVKTLYDERGRPEYVQSPDASGDGRTERIAEVTYSYDGLATTITDADGVSRTEVTDFLGRIVEVIEHAKTDQTTKYLYNAAGDLEYVYDALNNETHITYDKLGRKKTMDDPDMGSWSYDEYDGNGNLEKQTDAKGQVIKFTYDLLDRVTHKEYVDLPDPDVFYEYDSTSVPNGIGRLYSMSKKDSLPAVPVAKTDYEEYDALGRATLVTKSIKNSSGSLLSYQTGYDYDMSGKTDLIIYDDTTEVKYEYYEGTGLLHKVFFQNEVGGDLVEHAEFSGYEPTGKIGRIDYWQNTVYTDYFYDDSSQRLLSISTSATETIQDKSYFYSKAGDIEAITDDKLDVTHTYTYDSLHRLTGESSSVDVNDFTAIEIIPMYPDPGDGLPIHAVESVIMNGNNYTYQYDDNGNMEIGWDFTDPSNPAMRDIDYNADNMPKEITHETNGVTEYYYDGEGRRVKKVVNGTDKVYYVGDHYEVKDGEIVKYIFAGNIRLAMVDSSGVYYYHKDHLGSTAAMTRVDTSAIQPGSEGDYLPFGGYRTSSSVTLTSYAFTDQEQDAESGLYNYNARLYDPVIGQFITADPIVAYPYKPQSLNRYSYCLNNPLIYVDPTGHETIYDPNTGEFILDEETVTAKKSNPDAYSTLGDWSTIDRGLAMVDSMFGFGGVFMVSNAFAAGNGGYGSIYPTLYVENIVTKNYDGKWGPGMTGSTKIKWVDGSTVLTVKIDNIKWGEKGSTDPKNDYEYPTQPGTFSIVNSPKGAKRPIKIASLYEELIRYHGGYVSEGCVVYGYTKVGTQIENIIMKYLQNDVKMFTIITTTDERSIADQIQRPIPYN